MVVDAPSTTAEFSVNMTCGNCEQKVTKALTELGITNFKVSEECDVNNLLKDCIISNSSFIPI